MRKIGRKIALVLVFAMLAGLCIPGTTANAGVAADASTNKVTIDFAHEELHFDKTPEYDVAQYFPKTEDKSLAEINFAENIKEKDWVAHETEDEESNPYFDVSWFNKRKDSYAVVRVASGSAYEYYCSDLIKASKQPFKVGFTTVVSGASVGKTKTALVSGMAIGQPGTGYLYFYRDKDKKVELITPSSISFRKDGTYEFFPAIKTDNGTVKWLEQALSATKIKGATFFFAEADSDTGEKLEGWVTKEVKFKYAAQKNAPTVKLSANHSIALKDGQEYRVVNANGSVKSDWVRVHDKHMDGTSVEKGLRIEDLVVTGSGAGANLFADEASRVKGLACGGAKIQIRTAATNKALASKYTTIVVSQASISASDVTLMNAVTSAAIDISFTKVWDSKSGITITNRDKENSYEFAVVASGKAVDGNTKWSSLKDANDIKATSVLIKADSFDDDATICVRKVGDNRNGVLSSAYEARAVKDIHEVSQSVVTNDAVNNKVTGTTATVKVTTAPAVMATIAPSEVNGKAIENGKLTFKVEGMTKKNETLGWKTKGTDSNFMLNTPKYDANTGLVTVDFKIRDLKGKTCKSGDYTLVIEGLKITVSIEIKL